MSALGDLSAEELREMARKMKTTAATPPPPVCALPLEVPLKGIPPAQRVHVCLVGAGGTGGRVALLLPRLLRAGDVVSIVDPDVVEAKNLSRQHFHPADIGRPKAMVAAERLAAAAPEGLIVIPHVAPFAEALPAVRRELDAQLATPLHIPGTNIAYPSRLRATVYIGAVDNRQARVDISGQVVRGGRAIAWIDAGNDFRTGQVCLNLTGWPLQDAGVVDPKGTTLRPECGADLAGSRLCFPETLDPTKDAEDAHLTCVGFDTQSVGVNALAATYAANMLMWLLDGETIGVMALFFSTKGGTTTFPIMSAALAQDRLTLGR